MDLAYYSPVYLYKNIIQVYKGYLALAVSLINPSWDISGLVNSLYTFIIYYKAVYNPVTTQQNYKQVYRYDNNNEVYFTDRQYYKGGFKA